MKTAAITATATALALGLAIVAAQPTPARAAAGQATGADSDGAMRAAIDATIQGAAYAKLAISEQYMKTHVWAHDAAAVGFKAPDGAPGQVAIADGTIAVTFDAPAAIAGKTLRLIPSDTGDGTVHWRCEAPGLPAAVKPRGCE